MKITRIKFRHRLNRKHNQPILLAEQRAKQKSTRRERNDWSLLCQHLNLFEHLESTMKLSRHLCIFLKIQTFIHNWIRKLVLQNESFSLIISFLTLLILKIYTTALIFN